MRTRIVMVCLAVFLMSGAPAHGETIYCSIAASMTDAFKEIINQFSSNHPDDRILANYASSGSLAKQIDQGAPSDIYISANPKWMTFLKENKMIAEGTDHIFAYNKLVFVGGENAEIKQLTDIEKLNRIAIGSPQSVPAGQYAKQALESAGIYATLSQKKKLVMAKDVRQALLYADRGEVDGAFIYKTDALLAVTAKILFTVPDTLYDRVSYPFALTKAGADKKTAQAFYAFMAGPDCKKILSKYGFEPAQ